MHRAAGEDAQDTGLILNVTHHRIEKLPKSNSMETEPVEAAEAAAVQDRLLSIEPRGFKGAMGIPAIPNALPVPIQMTWHRSARVLSSCSLFNFGRRPYGFAREVLETLTALAWHCQPVVILVWERKALT